MWPADKDIITVTTAHIPEPTYPGSLLTCQHISFYELYDNESLITKVPSRIGTSHTSYILYMLMFSGLGIGNLEYS